MASEDTEASQGANKLFGRRKILVVDDDTAIIDFFVYSLRGMGYEVYTAQDGVEALCTILENHIDFVILDLMMPHLNGINTLRLMKKFRPHLPVLLCTGYLNTEHIIRTAMENYGAAGYLKKPFSLDLLEGYLRDHPPALAQLSLGT